MREIVYEFFEHSPEALLLCQRSGTQAGADYRVKLINKAARSVLGRNGSFSGPVPITELIPSRELLRSIDQAYATGIRQSGSTELSNFPHTDLPVAYTVEILEDSALIKLSQDGEAAVAQALGGHLLATDLTGVVIFEAVRNAEGEVEDLKLMFQNEAAQKKPYLGIQAQLGEYMTHWYPKARELGQFGRYVEVLETGVPFVSEKYYPDRDFSYHVAVSKHGDGVIISYYNRTEKLLALREIQHQNLVLDQIMQDSQDGIILWQPLHNEAGQVVDFKVMRYNRAALSLHDLQTPITDQSDGRLLSEVAGELVDDCTEVVASGTPLRTERLFGRKGHQVWLDISISRLGDRVLMMLKDISDYKKATRELHTQYQLLESILDSSENIIFVAEAVRDSSGTIVDFQIARGNQTAMNVFMEAYGIDVRGISIKELVGRQPELFEEAVRIVETGIPLILEQRYEPTSDKWFKVSMHKLDNGLVLTYVDITPVQTALLEARQQAELVQGVLDSSINGLYAMEPIRDEEGKVIDFKILMVNRAGLQLSDFSQEEMIGNTYLTLFPIVNQVGLFDQFRRAVEEGTPFRTEVGFPVPNEEQVRWFDLSLNLMGNGMIILTFMDTTERVLLSQKQEALLEKLRKSNQDLERFAYIASHDLSEPTRKINAFSEMLVAQYTTVLPRAGVDLVERIQSSSVRMQELVDGILTFSRFSSHEIEHELVSLKPLIEQVLADLEAAIEDKKATIELGEMPRVRGNQTQLRQLFQNLISNAMKFTDGHTPPHIQLEAGPASRKEMRETVLDKSRAWVAIRVRDNGIGFDLSQRSRVFELFTRLHGRSQYPGSGLGLAICKRVAELHGGSITVDSTPGQGTTFTVVLPALHRSEGA